MYYRINASAALSSVLHTSACCFTIRLTLLLSVHPLSSLSSYVQHIQAGDASVGTVVGTLWGNYKATTPLKLKIIDSYLLYILLTGVVQFVYCCLVGTFPFNSFLSGFISCVASFVLAGELRVYGTGTSSRKRGKQNVGAVVVGPAVVVMLQS